MIGTFRARSPDRPAAGLRAVPTCKLELPSDQSEISIRAWWPPLLPRLIALSQVRPYLVAARSSHGDFGPRFAHRPCHLDACRPLSFCGVALKRVAEASRDLFGHRIRKTRVIRTSNGYAFIDPKAGQHPVSSGNSSKSDFPSGTPIQESFLPKPAPAPRVL